LDRAIAELASDRRGLALVVSPLAVGEPQLEHRRGRRLTLAEAAEDRPGVVEASDGLVRLGRFHQQARRFLGLPGAQLLLRELEHRLDLARRQQAGLLAFLQSLTVGREPSLSTRM